MGPVRTTVAGVLLAAGQGSRFGGPKALIELGGQTLAERGVDLLRAGGADPIVVVTGAAPAPSPRDADCIQPGVAYRHGFLAPRRPAFPAIR